MPSTRSQAGVDAPAGEAAEVAEALEEAAAELSAEIAAHKAAEARVQVATRHVTVVTPVLVGSALLRLWHSPSCLFLRNRGDWRSLSPLSRFSVFGGAAGR